MKKFAHADHARYKRRGRQRKFGSQDEGSSGMCKQPTVLAESTTGCQGGAPAKPQVQKRALAGEQASATVQAEYSQANLCFISLCCPTPVLDSIAIESVIAHDLAKGLDHLAMHWTKELAPLNKATGLWRSVGSSNLMSGFVLGFTPSSCFQAEERCNRSLKSVILTNAHKMSIDQATDF